MPSGGADFKVVLSNTGSKPPQPASQHSTRHYSETFSRQVALWIRKKVVSQSVGAEVLTPEAKVDTIYGVGNDGKSLDVGVLDERKYLLIDYSIKTFNFKDKVTENYGHNFTGRFYELLGEELVLRRSYLHSTLVALIFLPEDSTEDKSPSSFARAVHQFSKCAKRDPAAVAEIGFEYVFVAVHNEAGDLYFFDATGSPPKVGHPPKAKQLSIESVLEIVRSNVGSRSALLADAPLPVYTPYKFLDPE